MIFLAHTNAEGKIVPEFPAQACAYMRRHFPAGTCIEYEVREQRSKRSDKQNRAMWALLHEWCRLADQGWRPDDLKDAVMGIVFGTIEITQPLTGQVVKLPAKLHTSALNVTEFCTVIEAILELAATSEPAVFLDAPDQYRKSKELAQKPHATIAAPTHGQAA